MAAKLMQFVASVNSQMERLTDPTQPDPTKEQLEKYATSVVGTLQKLVADAPPVFKERVGQSFGNHWNFQTNKPGTETLTALDLKASFLMMRDQLKSMPAVSKDGEKGKGKGKGGEEAPGAQPKKRFGGEQTSELKPLDSNELIGRIVGPQGSTLKLLELETQCKLDFVGDAVNITGPEQGVEAAIKAIDDIINKGYTNLTYGDGFAEITMKLHPQLLPDVKGEKWAHFIAIRDKLQVEIGIPDQGWRPDAKGKGKGKGKGQVKFATITIGGLSENVQEAKAVIDQLAKEFYHPITHPGKIAKHVPIENWNNLSFIIGTKGSEIKHMKNSFIVDVHIPNEVNKNDHIVIVGDEIGVSRCVKHIEGIIYKAENRPQRGEERYDPEAADDDYIDPIAQEYVYKRN